MYFVHRGTLRYEHCEQPAPECGEAKGRLPEGAWVCEFALWLTCLHRGTLTAQDKCEIAVLDAAKFREVAARNPAALLCCRGYARLFLRWLLTQEHFCDKMGSDEPEALRGLAASAVEAAKAKRADLFDSGGTSSSTCGSPSRVRSRTFSPPRTNVVGSPAPSLVSPDARRPPLSPKMKPKTISFRMGRLEPPNTIREDVTPMGCTRTGDDSETNFAVYNSHGESPRPERADSITIQ